MNDAVGFLAIGRQSRDVRLGVFVFARLGLRTEPCPFICFLGRIFPSLESRDDLDVVLGDEAPEPRNFAARVS